MSEEREPIVVLLTKDEREMLEEVSAYYCRTPEQQARYNVVSSLRSFFAVDDIIDEMQTIARSDPHRN